MKFNKLLLPCLLVICLGLNACAQNVSPNTYTTSDVGVASKVKKGVILSRRAVSVDNNSGVGGLAGAAAGATAGTMVGGSAATTVLGAIGGAVVGGVGGNMIDKGINHHQAYEYIIKLDGGQMISVTQVEDTQLQVHQHILVVYGLMTRIIPA